MKLKYIKGTRIYIYNNVKPFIELTYEYIIDIWDKQSLTFPSVCLLKRTSTILRLGSYLVSKLRVDEYYIRPKNTFFIVV